MAEVENGSDEAGANEAEQTGGEGDGIAENTGSESTGSETLTQEIENGAETVADDTAGVVGQAIEAANPSVAALMAEVAQAIERHVAAGEGVGTGGFVMAALTAFANGLTAHGANLITETTASKR